MELIDDVLDGNILWGLGILFSAVRGCCIPSSITLTFVIVVCTDVTWCREVDGIKLSWTWQGISTTMAIADRDSGECVGVHECRGSLGLHREGRCGGGGEQRRA